MMKRTLGCIEYDIVLWRRYEDGAQLCCVSLYRTVVRTVEAQFLLVQETRRADEFEQTGASQAQSIANNSAVENGTFVREAEGDENDGSRNAEKRYGMFINAAANFA